MKKFTCPFCDETSIELDGMHDHIEEEHETNIPENITINEFYYTHRTGKTHGNCVMCKRPTKWNETTNKFNRFCGREECKEQYVVEVRKRMVGKYGKTTLLNDPEHQKKMLKNRSISGTYKWSDNKHETDYTGSYEKDFLQYLDIFLNADPTDVMMPSPHTYYYNYEGKEHFYIPDAFIPSLNLEIEIKDGGDNPNMHHKIQDVDKVKERLKDEVMTSQKERSYIKIVNKEYSTFIQFLLMKKDEFSETGNKDKPIFILEKTKTYTIDDVTESALLEATNSFAHQFVLQQERIARYARMSYELDEERKSYDEYNCEDPLDYRAFNYANNYCNASRENVDRKSYNCKYSLFGIYYDQIANAFADYLCDSMDCTRTEAEKAYNKLILNIDMIHDYRDKSHYVNLTLERDLIAIVSIMQKIMNYSLSNIDQLDFFIDLYDKILGTYSRKLMLSTNEGELTLESALLESGYNGDNTVTESFVSKSNRTYHPVYVLLTHTGTVLSNTIKKITDNPYSHSSISFSPELDEMYSFGRKYKSNPLIGTFVRENIKEGLFEDVSETATYSLYVTFVDELSYRRMKKRLNEFKDPKKKFRYNFVGLIKHQMGIASTSTDAYFCSQFVDTILNENEIDFFAKDPSLVKPYDFAQHDSFLHVSRGKLKNYDVDKVKDKVKQLEFDARNKEEYNR